MAQNPYSTPQETSTSAIPDNPMSLNASQGKRFLNFIIDQLCLNVMSRAAGTALGTAFLAGRTRITPEEGMQLMIMGIVLGYAIVILFYLLFESTTGRTVGKFLTGTKVVAENGGKPSIGQIFGRTFARLVPFEPFSFFWGCDTKFPTGWHDRWSGTRVIDLKRIS